MKKLQKEIEIRQDKRRLTVSLLIVFLFVFVSVIRVVVANRLVEASDRLHALESQAARLSLENEKLARELGKSISLITLSQKAKVLGLIPPSRVFYLP